MILNKLSRDIVKLSETCSIKRICQLGSSYLVINCQFLGFFIILVGMIDNSGVNLEIENLKLMKSAAL